MNDTPTTTNSADTAPPVGTQLITLDPGEYVTAVFAPFRERLEAAKSAAAEVKSVDVSTADGMKTAIAHRATFRNLRVEAEKARVERKKPILDIGRLLDSRAKELEAEIEPLETRFDEAIKAEERRREEIRAAAEKAERERVERHQAALREIRGALIDVAGRDSGAIDDKIRELVALDVSAAAFQEFAAEAERVRDETVGKLRDMREAQLRAEKEAARVREEREAFEREKAQEAEAQRQREAEASRVATIRDHIDSIKSNPVDLIGRPARAIETRLGSLRAEKITADVYAEFTAEAQEALATTIQQLETMLTDAKARERLKAEQEALEQQQRQARMEQEQREREAREAREREEREAREKAEAEARQREAAEREKREAEEAASREEQRKANELLDGRELLASFVGRFGHREEFAAVTQAINAYLNGNKKPARSKAAPKQAVAS